MSDQITYGDKADLIVDTTIDDMFKVSASDMNEIKSVVNANAQEMDDNNAEVQDDIAVINNNITDLNNNKLDADAVKNEASTETDEVYSSDYLNDKLVSVGAEAPTNGEIVWFAKGKNLFNKNNANIINCGISGSSISASTANKTLYIPCQSNTVYTVQRRNDGDVNRFRVGACTTTPANGVTLSSPSIEDDSATSITITTGANDTYLAVMYYRTAETTLTEQEVLDSIQIEKGSTATSYEPYVEEGIYVDEEEFLTNKFVSMTKSITFPAWFTIFTAYADSTNLTINFSFNKLPTSGTLTFISSTISIAISINGTITNFNNISTSNCVIKKTDTGFYITIPLSQLSGVNVNAFYNGRLRAELSVGI